MKSPRLKSRHCPYCKLISFLCFWGPRKATPGNRIWLFLLSLLFTVLLLRLCWLIEDLDDFAGYQLALLPFVLMAALGLLVALHGCKACVARLFGNL